MYICRRSVAQIIAVIAPTIRDAKLIINFLQKFISMPPHTGIYESCKANFFHTQGKPDRFIFIRMRMRDKYINVTLRKN